MLYSEQKHLEDYMAEEAIGRQQRENVSTSSRDEWSNSRLGKTYVKAVMNMKNTETTTSLVAMISQFIDLTQKKGAGRHHLAAKMLNMTGLSASVIAFLTTKAVLNQCTVYNNNKGKVRRSTLCISVADYIHDEWRTKYFADTDRRKALLRKLFKDFDRRSYPREWRRRTIKNYFDEEQLNWQGWTKNEKQVIGYALVSMFKDATGYIEIYGDNNFVSLTESFVEHLQKNASGMVNLFTLFRPMVVLPRKWDAKDNLFKGPYLTDKIKKTSLVKGIRKADVPRLQAMDWSKIIPAINALQETPWRVNRQMLEATEWAYNELTTRLGHYRGIGKLPHCDEEPLPPLPDDYDTDPEVKKRHNRIVFDIRDRRREAKGKRINANMAIAIAKKFQTYEKIYFPHNLDSRGRAYPLPAFLNPQGPDYVKALLEFSEGKPVETQEQLNWIAIAGANAYGKDKISLAERVQWVNDNEQMILEIAQDYKNDRRWLEAGEPFQFLRFCFEWMGYHTLGLGYVSHMVCPVDATCSGLQHYAAMLRDEVGGKSVNLIPGYSRQDIYGDVANVVIAALVADNTPIARDWLTFGIDRKITKRQVMVVPYAGKFSSCMAYTREAVEEKLADGHPCPWDRTNEEDDRERMVYLAKLIWSAIDQVVVRGKVAMAWLSKVASEYSKVMNATDLPVYQRAMRWTTPDGFEVVHFREDEALNRIETSFEGRVRLSFYQGTGKLSPKDMALAVAPNFVHALDATHLRSTIIKALDHGITDFAMIHDSFGVHAALMPAFLQDCVKPAFVEMYEKHDVIEEFADKFKDVCQIPDLPEMGSLNIRGVLKSEFFFS